VPERSRRILAPARIQGELDRLCIEIATSTVWSLLQVVRGHPPPARRMLATVHGRRPAVFAHRLAAARPTAG
jgi:hypothetical protein